MPGNSKKKGETRRAAALERKKAISEQYGVPMSALESRTPEFLGRSMFLTKRDANKFQTAFGKARRGEGLPENLKQQSAEVEKK